MLVKLMKLSKRNYLKVQRGTAAKYRHLARRL